MANQRLGGDCPDSLPDNAKHWHCPFKVEVKVTRPNLLIVIGLMAAT